MRNSNITTHFLEVIMGSIMACGVFAGVMVPTSSGGIFTEIHVGKWIPTGQDVIVGVMATLPNSCTLFDGIESDAVAPDGKVPGQLNIRVTIIPAPYNIEPEASQDLGCRNETHFVYEKINFGPLDAGPYEVRVFENGQLGISKMLNVSEFPVDPIFSEPGGYYNIGQLGTREALMALDH